MVLYPSLSSSLEVPFYLLVGAQKWKPSGFCRSGLVSAEILVVDTEEYEDESHKFSAKLDGGGQLWVPQVQVVHL